MNDSPTISTPQAVTELQRLADQCVMCGMCLPHCPTYHLTRSEAESPRGRLSLIQGLSSGRLSYSPPLAQHLDHCLACRACESVCPSGVRYGEIIVRARAALADKRPAPSSWKRLAALRAGDILAHRPRLHRFGQLLRLLQRSGLQTLTRRLAGGQTWPGRLAALLPPLPSITPWQEYYPPRHEHLGDVGLFLGCVTDLAERAALHASIRLLTRLGYGVRVPREQTCCGALHLHSGNAVTARRLASINTTAFDTDKLTAVVTVASGCGATLAETMPGVPVRDISAFLNAADWPADLRLAPLPNKVAVHDPCSLTHMLKQSHAPYRLLERIPEITLVPLPDNRRCCGAAGSYMLSEPTMAEALRDEKIAALKALKPDILVTSNIGCAMHMRAGIAAAGLAIPIMHPVELLASRWQDGGTS